MRQIRQFPLAVGLLAGLLTAPAPGYDVLVSVTGEIYGNTCVVSEESATLNVSLGAISSHQFANVGSAGNIRQPFSIKLEDCGPTFSGVRVRFSGTADENNTDLLKLNDGGAEGVGVQILDDEGEAVALNDWSGIRTGSGDGTMTVKFYARLLATKMPVVAGEASAVATWEVEYQ